MKLCENAKFVDFLKNKRIIIIVKKGCPTVGNTQADLITVRLGSLPTFRPWLVIGLGVKVGSNPTLKKSLQKS